LKKNGKIAIQAPARDVYCPNFIKAIYNVGRNELTKDIFANFIQPWLFLNTSEEYSELFQNVGFMVKKSWIDEVVTYHSVEEAYKIFESGAAAGYLNQTYYSKPISEEYLSSFRSIVKNAFEEEVDNTGKVKLVFYRIYLLAIKE